MAKVSFIDRVQPHRSRTKLVEVPFHVEGDERPKIRVRVLGQDALEEAYLAAVEHFKALKKKVEPTDSVFVHREHVELVLRAYEDPDGEPLAASADDLAKQPAEIIAPLYAEWSRFQDEVTIRPLTVEQMESLIDGLKKNTHTDLLPALPSSWLIELARTLGSQLANSTQDSSLG